MQSKWCLSIRLQIWLLVLPYLLLPMYSAVFSCFIFSQWKDREKYSFALDSTSASVVIIYFCLSNSFCSEQADQNWKKRKECTYITKFYRNIPNCSQFNISVVRKNIWNSSFSSLDFTYKMNRVSSNIP